jgi:phenylalanyl-tRNA synthetase beta chain
MPTITISVQDLCSLIGRRMTPEELSDALNLTKCGHTSPIGDEMAVEVTSDRPDLLSTEGIARELKGLLGIETGLRKYKVGRSDVELTIDRSVLDIRPYMSSAVLEGVKLTGDAVRQIMQMQEKIHATYGRNRRKVSIGVHDFDKVTHKLTYAGVEPEKINFIPLDETRTMNGKEILELTPKGREYAGIIKGFPRYPLLYDSEGNVLSLPPIINGVITKVTDQTRNILLDVTGTEKKSVDHALTLMVTALAERGAAIKSVQILSPQGQVRTPDLSARKRKLRPRLVYDVLGVQLSSRQIATLLGKMRYGVTVKGNAITVIVPPYRRDILHEVDLVEDVAIAYGYSRFKPEIPLTATVGREREVTTFARTIRDLMIGFGFQEVFTFIMTSPQILFEKMNAPPEEVVEVENPISLEYSVLRHRLLPGLINFLSYNKHVAYPQKIFECGDVVLVDKNAATGAVNRRKLSGAICNYSVSYEDAQAVVYSLLRNVGVQGWSVERLDHQSFIRGRAARMILNNHEIGLLGEINPTVLERFGLENPLAAFEIDVEKLMSERAGTASQSNAYSQSQPRI